MMAGRSILAFAAGLGTGYLNGKKQQEDKERQDKIDARNAERDALDKRRIEAEIAEKEDAAARRKAVSDGLAKVGQTNEESAPTDTPAVDTSMGIDQGNDVKTFAIDGAPDVTTSPQAQGITIKKQPSKGDILRQTAEALKQGDINQQVKAIELMNQAGEFDIKQLQTGIVKSLDMDEFNKNAYDLFPDGKKFGGEMGRDRNDGTSRYYVWTETPDGKRGYINQNFESFEDFKTFMAKYVSDNHEEVLKYYQESRAADAARQKAALDEKKANNAVTIAEMKEDRRDDRLNRTLASREEIASNKQAGKSGSGKGGSDKDWNKEMLPVIKEVNDAVLNFPDLAEPSVSGQKTPNEAGRYAQQFAQRLLKANPDMSINGVAEIARAAAIDPAGTKDFKTYKQADGKIIKVPVIKYKGQIYEYSNSTAN